MNNVQPPGAADQWRPRAGTNAHLEQPFAPMAASHRAPRPHLLLLHACDLGASEIGAYGGVHAETPSIDRLALSGVRFTEAYADRIDGPDLAEALSRNGYAVDIFGTHGRADLETDVASAVDFIGSHRSAPWLAYVRLQAARQPLASVLGYAAAVDGIDQAVGRLVSTLRRSDQYRSTLVLLVGATHGERLVLDRSQVAAGGPRQSADRVPMLLSWPGQVPPRQRHDQAVRTADWMPTLLGIAQAGPPSDQIAGGVDLTEHLLDGGDVPARGIRGNRAA